MEVVIRWGRIGPTAGADFGPRAFRLTALTRALTLGVFSLNLRHTSASAHLPLKVGKTTQAVGSVLLAKLFQDYLKLQTRQDRRNLLERAITAFVLGSIFRSESSEQYLPLRGQKEMVDNVVPLPSLHNTIRRRGVPIP
ncbi:unnamed protein product [Ophioblennius macclurei]